MNSVTNPIELDYVPGQDGLQRLRPGVQALLFQVLRQAGRAEALRRQLAARAPAPAADALLCSALALCWDPQASPYEPFTLVNQAVEAAKPHPPTRAQASFINGCLRRFLRERDALVAVADVDHRHGVEPAAGATPQQRDQPGQRGGRRRLGDRQERAADAPEPGPDFTEQEHTPAPHP